MVMGDSPAGVMAFELPTGWVGPDGQVHRRVEIREMTGYEEDLIGDDRLPYGVRVNRILAGCVEKLGPITDKKQLEKVMEELTSVDRMKILIAIRVASLGAMFEFEGECPSCKVKERKAVDLLTLQFVGMKDPKVREYEVVLPSGRKAKCKILTGGDEVKVMDMPPTDILSAAILIRLVSLDDAAPTLEGVKKMGLKDRQFLRKKFDEMEGGFERNIQVECGKCRTEYERRLDVGMFELLYKDVRM